MNKFVVNYNNGQGQKTITTHYSQGYEEKMKKETEIKDGELKNQRKREIQGYLDGERERQRERYNSEMKEN